jgi:hypothetical protein
MSEQRIPGDKTLRNVSKLAINDDRPIMLDYYIPSLDGNASIGVRRTKQQDGTFKETGEKLLVKSADEYTSTITKTYKCDQEYIIFTENSIYIVSTTIKNTYIS